MNYLHALILGIVEGLTEFIPVSSTAHIQFAAQAMGLEFTPFLKTFEIAIQFGAILAVVLYYGSTLRKSLSVWKKIIYAFIPTALIGFIAYPYVKGFLGNNILAAWALIIGGALLIVIELIVKKRQQKEPQPVHLLPTSQALVVGTAQTLAFIPGVSRSGASIIIGLLSGIPRKTIIEFSFLLAIPTIAAAAGYDLLKADIAFTGQEIVLLVVGGLAAFFSALFTIRILLQFVEKHTFIGFGIYRIIIGLVVLLSL